MTEQQVKEEVLRYLRDKSYNYAILIDGEWGCGKTFFVKNSLSEAIEAQENVDQKRDIKYISLYGCKSIMDIQGKIAWSFAEKAQEKLGEKASISKRTTKITKNILSVSEKIGNAILSRYDSDYSVYSIAADWLNMETSIFVFDDLERCDCPINEIFGFLNELVEHKNTKVIIVANEKEISKITEPKYLEQQYGLALEERIEWPKPRNNNILGNRRRNTSTVSLAELDRRRELLFPTQYANSEYKKIREKLIGVTLRYTPDVPQIMFDILSSLNYKEEYKLLLFAHRDSFKSSMDIYRHHNLRTFQFFLSKVSYLLEKLEDISLDKEYLPQIQERILTDTFSMAVELKADYRPSRNDSSWLSTEQDTGINIIKKYVESGEFLVEEFEQSVLTLQKELQASVPDDDPYYLVYQQYYYHTQTWCEEQLNKMIEQLKNNRYPLSFYSKIIIAIQRLLDLGFDPNYMQRAKGYMLENIASMGEEKPLVAELWFDGDPQFMERVRDVVAEINSFIFNRSTEAGYENIMEILSKEDWINRLILYTSPDNSWYADDIPVFSKANSELWLTKIHEATPKDLDDFRHWLYALYPIDTVRKSYQQDGLIIKEIIAGLKELQEKDLIKKAGIGWLIEQFNTIVEINESEIVLAEEKIVSDMDE